MKTIKHFALALVAVACGLGFTSCDQNNPDNYADYPQLIVGKWFNFNPNSSVFINYDANGKMTLIGWDKVLGWMSLEGTYSVDGNTVIEKPAVQDLESHPDQVDEIIKTIEVNNNILTFKTHSLRPDYTEQVHYRVKEQFDITGKYSYLNSAVRVVPAEGKTALQLPEGVTFQGQNSIPVDAMHGDRIIDVMKKFFADATFAADGKLNHTLDGEAKTKNYTLDGNNLTFNLYEGSETYKVNATSFPDEDGDRLFIIIPKQAAWLGGMVDMIEKEQAGLKLTEAQIAELEKEFMATFDTFTVILSLSKK
ncbi:MAG: hypothetical protein J6S09_07800 [Paludibacteraceae bacterium]|nr:hypothetical protein [Paludibacteraceae bacterium]